MHNIQFFITQIPVFRISFKYDMPGDQEQYKCSKHAIFHALVIIELKSHTYKNNSL
uniref:Uncharacterized protein n=1 Tax=Rhizophora mucronata TaxID=61149 RepID=A0A2P2QD78_RHIMU